MSDVFLVRFAVVARNSMTVQAIPRSSLVDAVVEQIRDIIEQGELAAGDRLPTESSLAKQLGVSRTVLREAIGRLETIGVLSVRRGLGMYVGDRSSLNSCVKLVRSAMAISPKELSQFTEFRQALECYCVRRAAELASPGDVEELAELCRRIDREGENYLESMRWDFRFHLKIVEISGNPLLLQVMEVIQEFALAGMAKTTPRPRDRVESHRRHMAIVDAIRSGDPARAESSMRQHMHETLSRLRDLDVERRATAGS